MSASTQNSNLRKGAHKDTMQNVILKPTLLQNIFLHYKTNVVSNAQIYFLV